MCVFMFDVQNELYSTILFFSDEQQTIVFGQNITKDQLYDIVITTEAGDLRSEPSIFQIKTCKLYIHYVRFNMELMIAS